MDYKYDLFISFKNSVNSKPTVDKEVAEDLYFRLVSGKEGFRVFYSNWTLHEIGSANYIFELQKSLEEAKNILIVFSDTEYISKGWVAQEWTTFLNLRMTDPVRQIYLYSITKNSDKLPAFLRPYECFIDPDTAVRHLTNGLTSNTAASSCDSGCITKRDFLNAYWGLFGNIDISLFLDKKIVDDFKNYRVYYCKAILLEFNEKASYVQGLTDLAENEENPLAMYLLSRYYRNIDYLDLRKSFGLSKLAYRKFVEDISCCKENGEILLMILTDKKEYDGAFYMCDILYDVLSAYNVTTTAKIIDPSQGFNVDFDLYKKSVVLWSAETLDCCDEFIDSLNTHGDKVFICLNDFCESALPERINGCKIFENTNQNITKLCRELLG